MSTARKGFIHRGQLMVRPARAEEQEHAAQECHKSVVCIGQHAVRADTRGIMDQAGFVHRMHSMRTDLHEAVRRLAHARLHGQALHRALQAAQGAAAAMCKRRLAAASGPTLLLLLLQAAGRTC